MLINYFIFLFIFSSSLWAAATDIKVVRNSKEVVTLNVTPQDQLDIAVCQQSSVELNFMDEMGVMTPIKDIVTEKELDPIIGFIQRYQEKNSYLLMSALSYKTFNQYVKDNVDLTDVIRITKLDKSTYTLKVRLIYCSSDTKRIRTINIKSKQNLENLLADELPQEESIEEVLVQEEKKADKIVEKIVEIEKNNGSVKFEITSNFPKINQEEIQAMKEAEDLDRDRRSQDKATELLNRINQKSSESK